MIGFGFASILLSTTNTATDYSLFLGFIGGVIPVVGAILAGVNWLNNRFAAIERSIAANASDIRLLDQKWDSIADKITLVANGNSEAVRHARERFFDELRRLDRELSNDLNDISSYLAKKGDFVIRTRSISEND